MHNLKSYLSGSWHSGTDSTLVNPMNGEAVAHCGSRALVLGAAVTYGQDVGGPALRPMSFTERCALPWGLAAVSYTHRTLPAIRDVSCSAVDRYA